MVINVASLHKSTPLAKEHILYNTLVLHVLSHSNAINTDKKCFKTRIINGDYSQTHHCSRNLYVTVQRARYSAPSFTSGSRAHAHVSCQLSVLPHRFSLKVWVLSGRSIAACPWPYLRQLETKNRGRICGLRSSVGHAFECRVVLFLQSLLSSSFLVSKLVQITHQLA